MFKVFVTRKIPDIGINLLKQAGYEVIVSPHNRVLMKKELIELGRGADALVTLLTDSIDSKILNGVGKQLKVIANYAVGFDNIDLKVCAKRGIKVANTPDPAISLAVAEHTFALMIALAKRMVEADEFLRRGKYKGWDPDLLVGTQLLGKTLGVIGLGRIGKTVVQIANKGFNMNVMYNDVRRDEAFEKEFTAKYASMEEILKDADFVSLHVPLLPSTMHLINKDKLAMMKKTAFLINTARGAVVNENELYDALEQGVIAGAGVDVLECEPLLACNPLRQKAVRQFKNLIVTPHTASATHEAREKMAELAAKNIIAGLRGDPLLTPVATAH